MNREFGNEDTPISLVLGETLQQFVAEEVVRGGYNDAASYLYHLVREEQKRVIRARVLALLREGAASPLQERTEADWAVLRAEVAGLTKTTQTETVR